MARSSKPTYEELVLELENLLNAVALPNGSLFSPLIGSDFLKVRDAIGKARGIVARAKGWQSQTLAEAAHKEPTASELINDVAKAFNQMTIQMTEALDKFNAYVKELDELNASVRDS